MKLFIIALVVATVTGCAIPSQTPEQRANMERIMALEEGFSR